MLRSVRGRLDPALHQLNRSRAAIFSSLRIAGICEFVFVGSPDLKELILVCQENVMSFSQLACHACLLKML
ncbi:hypothetical protein J5N97_008160 [Dioscorea zingiberensis]|uniref:Uncharacterized protein n=1 Tax=Dioscorea zingiberensis TaxID=325984 RepID=A0A9D5DE55_9LILI|nr:hypothetical protein J5N97_008160 [Dioscorea zingiberensis]